MKTKFLILILIGFATEIFCEELNMNKELQNAVNYFFEVLIPEHYQGKEDFSNEQKKAYIDYNFGIQGDKDIFSNIEKSENIVFNFYYLINHDKQTIQSLCLLQQEINNSIYEYWIFMLSDKGVPYDYSYFYITKADSKIAKREIIDVSRKYKESFNIKNGIKLDLSINNLSVLYQIEPQLKLESFKNTKYENMIIKWKNQKPYLRKMNLFERIYYKKRKKSNK